MKLKNHSPKKALLAKVALGLCVLGGSLFAGNAAHAADGITAGVLDETKLGKGYTKYSNELAELNTRAKTFDAQLDAREVMNDTDGKRFDALVAKASRSKEEEDEFKKLVDDAAARRKRSDALVGQASRTPEEEKFLTDTQGFRKANVAAVRRLEDDLFQDLKTSEEKTHQKYIELANQMVQKVAGDKKLTVVFRKDAVVWFSPTIDITDEVLNRLNKQ